ncbi:MAG: GAF domain-containing protein [Anaerolineales bacterium]|nr:GAF domain-containing protein [Anaerolineales bacterium]
MNESQTTQVPKENTGQRGAFSLRAKILLGNFLIVLLTVAAMGYFVFYRSKATNDFLVNQVGISVDQEIENRLAATVSREANTTNLFFSTIRDSIEFFGNTAGTIISNDKKIVLGEGEWDAFDMLAQLPNGSWDNANSEPASIFIPARTVLQNDIARELTVLKGLDDLTLSLLETNPEIIAIYFGGKHGETVYYPNIDLAAIVPPDFDVTTRPWFIGATESPDLDTKAVWSTPYQDAALNGLVITSSIPVYDDNNEFRGVAAIDILLTNIIQQVSSISIGRSGYGFLIDKEGRVIAMPAKGFADFNLTEEELHSGNFENLSLLNRVPLDVFEVLAKMTSGQTGVRQVAINGVNRYIAYQSIPFIEYSLGIVVSEDEVLQDFIATTATVEEETHKTLFSAAGVSLLLLSLAGLAAYGIGNSITAPLGKLTKAAEEVAEGNLDARADVITNDEIGLLARTLNSMASTAQGLIFTLEERVAERTQLIEKRVTQIQAVAEVGKSVAAQRDLEELLTRTSHLISDRFDFYHIGIFLLDTRRQYAILRASNSNEGAKMLERGHKLGVGMEGIAGTVAGTGQARIALDVGEDAVYFNNPDLPKTRSEMALPLNAGGETLGVLDIQSVEANAFSEEDIPTLQVLADQLAIAVQNARLLRDSQEALMLARKATGDISQTGWQSLLQNVDGLGYVSLMNGEVVPASNELEANMQRALLEGESVLNADQKTLNMPISVRGQTVATMRLVKPTDAASWTPDEIEDIEALSAQLSNTLDSARLYQEAQRRAARERAIGEMTTNIGASTDIEAILRTAAMELGRQLSGTKVAVELSTEIEQEESQEI